MNKSPLWKHIAALLYDVFPILGLFLTTSLLIMLIRNGQEVPAGTSWFQLLLFFEVFLYFTYSWKSGGQTLGMRAWKLAIVDYKKLTWLQVASRFFVGLASVTLLGMGLWIRYIKGQTWMDSTSQTQTISLVKTA